MSKLVHVAVGVIQDSTGRILIARRPEHLHQGGLWEFPGGKVAAGEDVLTALKRELHEEIGIDVEESTPLISIEHDYGDKHVWLDVHRVTGFSGEAHGKEGQPIRWVPIDELTKYDFPAANRGILNAIRLPDRYMITGTFANNHECLAKIQRAIEHGVRLIQLRAPHLNDAEYLALAKLVLPVQQNGVAVILNTSVTLFENTQAAGLHLNSTRLLQTQQRPVPNDKLLSASVHNEQELAHANKIGTDFIVVSPVLPTASHPAAPALGWQRFAELTVKANCPAYALGGLRLTDMQLAQQHGAQGIAGISTFNKDL